MADWRKAAFFTMLLVPSLCVHAQLKPTPAGASGCITRAAMRAALEEVMPPRPKVIPPPGLALLARPTDTDCATIEHLKTTLRLAQSKRW